MLTTACSLGLDLMFDSSVVMHPYFVYVHSHSLNGTQFKQIIYVIHGWLYEFHLNLQS